jgi:hypothetical protein
VLSYRKKDRRPRVFFLTKGHEKKEEEEFFIFIPFVSASFFSVVVVVKRRRRRGQRTIRRTSCKRVFLNEKKERERDKRFDILLYA